MSTLHLELSLSLAAMLAAAPANAQVAPSGPPIQLVQPAGPAAPPSVVTLKDALERARQNDAQFQAAATDAQVAAGDRVQAKASLLPNISHTTQYQGTQGNGQTPNGRFVTNDGVHVYRSWMVLHQDLSPNTLTGTVYRRAQAAEAVAKARVEIARARACGGRDPELLCPRRRAAAVCDGAAGGTAGSALFRHQPAAGATRSGRAQRCDQSADSDAAATAGLPGSDLGDRECAPRPRGAAVSRLWTKTSPSWTISISPGSAAVLGDSDARGTRKSRLASGRRRHCGQRASMSAPPRTGFCPAWCSTACTGLKRMRSRCAASPQRFPNAALFRTSGTSSPPTCRFRSGTGAGCAAS